MFSIFKKKPKLSNVPLNDLSKMLWEEELNPTYKKEFFQIEKLDLSIDSLKHIDEFLEIIHLDQPDEEEVLKIALRVGAYLGEVIRKHASEGYNWLDYNEATKVNKLVEQLGMQLATSAVLWSKPDNVMFPISKVLKFIENGNEDSLYFLAQVVINGMPQK